MNSIITQARDLGKHYRTRFLYLALAAFFAAWGLPAGAEEAPALIFVHGIKGSELLTSEGKVQWISAMQALGLSTPDLRLETRFEDGKQPIGPLVPGKILARINVLPVVVGVDIYGPWLKAAQQMGGKAFYQFSYDWRRDNLETMATFGKFVESVKARHGGKKVQVVGHSMGGMLTLAAMNRNPELFDRVVLAGSPFGGGIGFLPDLHGGVSTGLNGAIVGPDVVRTFTSVFCFFPEKPGNLLDAKGAVIDADFYKAEDWRRLKIGMYAEGREPEGYAPFFTEALARAKRFRELLRPDPSKGPNPPVLVIAGKKFSTLSQAIQGGEQSELGWDFESAPKVPGDGRVAYVNAMPPEGIAYRVFETDRDHTDLLSDPKVQKAIEDFLK